MNAHRDDGPGAMEKLGARVRQRALTGTEASTVGFILVAYIGAFAGLGYWLDTLFKTSWLVAVGVLLGAVIGFREMFRIAQKLTHQSIAQDDANERAALQNAQPQSTQQSERPSLFTESAMPGASTPLVPEAEDARARPRLFAVPPPPAASFDKAKPARSEPMVDVPDDAQEVIERLLESEKNEDEKK